jgi:hypothetical protein
MTSGPHTALDGETDIASNTTDFTRTLTIDAAPAALRSAITTAEGVSGWWMPTTSPEPEILRVSFGDRGADLRVIPASDLVIWDVVSCSAEPDWVGTTIEFSTANSASPSAPPSPSASAPAFAAEGRFELVFTHRGLGALPCAENCFAGWSHFLPSLVSFVESGIGNPGPRQ